LPDKTVMALARRLTPKQLLAPVVPTKADSSRNYDSLTVWNRVWNQPDGPIRRRLASTDLPPYSIWSQRIHFFLEPGGIEAIAVTGNVSPGKGVRASQSPLAFLVEVPNDFRVLGCRDCRPKLSPSSRRSRASWSLATRVARSACANTTPWLYGTARYNSNRRWARAAGLCFLGATSQCTGNARLRGPTTAANAGAEACGCGRTDEAKRAASVT
jgi:hypothetical protein